MRQGPGFASASCSKRAATSPTIKPDLESSGRACRAVHQSKFVQVMCQPWRRFAQPARWAATSPEGDGSTSLICTHMYDSFRVHGGDDHSHCTMMSRGDDHRGFANATDRWLCNCEQNRQPSASGGDRNRSLTPLKRLRTTSPYIGIVFAAHNDEDFGAKSHVAARRPPRSNANVDLLFLFSP